MTAGIVLASHAKLATRNLKHFSRRRTKASACAVLRGPNPPDLFHALGQQLLAAFLRGLVVAVAAQ